MNHSPPALCPIGTHCLALHQGVFCWEPQPQLQVPAEKRWSGALGGDGHVLRRTVAYIHSQVRHSVEPSVLARVRTLQPSSNMWALMNI